MSRQEHSSGAASRRQLLIGTAGVSAAGLGLAQQAVAATRPAAPQAAPFRRNASNLLTLKDGNTLFYKDWGSGTPVVFSHGWPLSADAWDAQMVFLAERGYRVIAHDRRGHGRSSQSFLGNDMDTYADDLAALTDALDLQGAVHVGHSTGGGEVARYIARHGAKRAAKAVLVSAVPPWMARSAGNPDGIPMEVFDGLRAGVRADRSQLYRDLSAPFFGTNRPEAKPYPGLRDAFWLQGMAGSHKSLLDCIKAFSETDFTADLRKLDVPTLLVHGDDDQIVPIDIASRRSVKLVRNALLKEYTGAPHGLPLTHADQLNADLLAFIRS